MGKRIDKIIKWEGQRVKYNLFDREIFLDVLSSVCRQNVWLVYINELFLCQEDKIHSSKMFISMH